MYCIYLPYSTVHTRNYQNNCLLHTDYSIRRTRPVPLPRILVPAKKSINRVGAAVAYLTARLGSLGYHVNTMPVTDWQEGDIPSPAQMTQYLANIAALRDRLPYVAPDAPEDMVGLTYQEANAIEEILYTLEKVLEAMQAAFLPRQANTLFMIAGGVFNHA